MLFFTHKPTKDIIGETAWKHHENICKELGINTDVKESTKLINSMFDTDKLYFSDLLLWYFEHGMAIKNVTYVAEFQRQRPFEEFAKKVTQCRVLGDIKVNGQNDAL